LGRVGHLRFRSLLAAVAAGALAVAACGSDSSSGTTTTEAKSSATFTSTCPDFHEKGVLAGWASEYCRAAELPGVIVLLDLAPAFGDPSTGTVDYDWSALQTGCERLGAAMPPLSAVLDDAPTEASDLVNATRGYVTQLTAVSEDCVRAAEAEDAITMRALADQLIQAGSTEDVMHAYLDDLQPPS
jgi:hypothetical protein